MKQEWDHPHLRLLDPLADAMELAARQAARVAKDGLRRLSPRRRNSTLRPGSNTPLWNQLVAACQPYLRKRGEKAKLARILGVSRQRLHVMLVAKSACADGERALQLLAWLNARRRGFSPA